MTQDRRSELNLGGGGVILGGDLNARRRARTAKIARIGIMG